MNASACGGKGHQVPWSCCYRQCEPPNMEAENQNLWKKQEVVYTTEPSLLPQAGPLVLAVYAGLAPA